MSLILILNAACSSLLFGATHLIRLAMGQPVTEVGLLVMDASISGIFYAGVVLYSGSIWPAVACHVVPNAVVGAYAAASPGFTETVEAWIPILLSQIPVAAAGVFLLVQAAPGGEA